MLEMDIYCHETMAADWTSQSVEEYNSESSGWYDDSDAASDYSELSPTDESRPINAAGLFARHPRARSPRQAAFEKHTSCLNGPYLSFHQYNRGAWCVPQSSRLRYYSNSRSGYPAHYEHRMPVLSVLTDPKTTASPQSRVLSKYNERAPRKRSEYLDLAPAASLRRPEPSQRAALAHA